MLIEELADQLKQGFRHEKRSPVCLWFDEHREFIRLLPALRTYLGRLPQHPFSLLEYDESQRHGQIWLKHEMYRSPAGVRQLGENDPRFVIYLPFPPERFEQSGPGGQPPLELLIEYQITGIAWRIDGKLPTLSGFLRKAGVPLPTAPQELHRLCAGGADSLLAKYSGRFSDAPRAFWQTTILTPQYVQSQLISDVDQTLIDLASDPQGAWGSLQERKVLSEFLEMVRERYGFDHPATTPDTFIREFVARLALTDAFLGYSEPKDFPFTNRLPPEPLRRRHQDLLGRWLRDAEGRGAWDMWIREAERDIDLSSWARGRDGTSSGFPHLVQLRWAATMQSFESAAGKSSTLHQFFDGHRATIAREAESGATSQRPVGAWWLLRDLDSLVRACKDGQGRVTQLNAPSELAATYVGAADSIELRHMRIRRQAEEEDVPVVQKVADRVYAEYGNDLNTRFFQGLAASGTTVIQDFPAVTPHLEETLWKAKGRRAVLIVDALRYDCAIAIKEKLREREVQVSPVVGMLPTVTPVGMTAVMPLSDATVALEVKGNNLHPMVNGKDMSARGNRIAYLEAFGAQCLEIADVESASDPPVPASDLLVVIGHDDVDHLGHGDAGALVRHVHVEVERLARIVRKLHQWGYPVVHVVTDHGFILLDPAALPPEVRCDKEWCLVYKERFALVLSRVELPLTSFPFDWDGDVRVAVPPGLAFFKRETGYSHGGATLQEMIIPHLVSMSHSIAEKRIGVEVELPADELMRTAVKVVLRVKSGQASAGLFPPAEVDRTLVLNVLRPGEDDQLVTVLDGGPKEVRLQQAKNEESITLFFRSACSFRKGEILDLDIRDVETGEQFPPGGVSLTVGRDM